MSRGNDVTTVLAVNFVVVVVVWLIGNRTSCRPIRSIIILVIKQIGLSLRGHPILLITRTIIDRIDLHSVLLITTMYHSGGSARARAKREWAEPHS